MLKWMAIDMDGTVADCDHRLKHILDLETGKKLPGHKRDYKKFFSGAQADTPLYDQIEIIQKVLEELKAFPVFITGRPSREMYFDSVIWISKHLPFVGDGYNIMMREHLDRRPDYETKADLMRKAMDIFGGAPVAWAEDRYGVAKVWADIAPKALGILFGEAQKQFKQDHDELLKQFKERN
jgi:hypothetical protein